MYVTNAMIETKMLVKMSVSFQINQSNPRSFREISFQRWTIPLANIFPACFNCSLARLFVEIRGNFACARLEKRNERSWPGKSVENLAEIYEVSVEKRGRISRKFVSTDFRNRATEICISWAFGWTRFGRYAAK